MINQQTLELYIYVDGINDVPFFSGGYEQFILSNGEQFVTSDDKVFNVRALNEDIVIHAFTYNAKRMGSAPTITATIKYSECLDELFSQKVYALFNGEKYFLVATPSSSYSNSEVVYKHDATFVSERAALENTYCYDVVSEDFANDTIVSNNSEFSFFGDIHEFAQRLNYSLNYSGLDYTVIVDAGIESDEELIIVDNKFFSDVLQEAYNTYDLPYYFVGKEIHIGYSTNAIEDVFRYGDSDALVSISKTNANQRTINRVTGLGSGDNLPYYYPNATPKGNVAAVAGESNVGIKDSDITILDVVKFANEVEVSDEIVYREGRSALPSGYLDNTYQTFTAKDKNVLTNITRRFAWHNGQTWASMEKISGSVVISTQSTIIPTDCQFVDFNNEVLDIKSYLNITSRDINNNMYIDSTSLWDVHDTECTRLVASLFEVDENGKIDYDGFSQSFVSHSERLRIDIPENLSRFGIRIDAYYDIYGWDDTLVTFDVGIEVESTPYWDKNGDHISLQDIALEVSGTPVDGDTIKQTLVGGYMKPQKTLILPIYRETLGEKRFYNAINDTYFIPDENGLDSGLKYEFENEYNGHNPKEQIVQFEEIKPTIKGMSNSEGLRIDMFSEFAYDEDDNNETFETEDGTIKYRHPYFFGKLRKLDFNLFDHATEDGEMVIAMTNGHCGGCEFKVAVDADTKKNTVQVDENGNLVYENGYVVCGAEDYQSPVDPQPQQQDTINNEVWIALYKDKDTFGEIMPNTTPNRAIRPQACSTPTENDGDTFVILNINLPHQYIIAAEEELRQQVIQFMWDNNREKFNFAIKFSRIYFAEHPEILALLDENARIIVEYDDVQYTMYVSSLSYKATETEILPEITVELKDELSVSKNAIQRAESRVKADVYRTINGMDIIAQGAQVFLRKDMPDTARQPITFKEKTTFDGEVTLSNQIATNDYFQGEKGLRIGKDANNNWHIEADFLDVRKKFYAKEVEIQKVYHIGGAQIKSAASLVCSKVDDIGDSYRCWFENSDIDGNVIENQFVVGDQAYVRTFNLITDENGNTTNHFYWRLVVGVDANSIVLSKEDCADGSTVPMVGDNIVQLGNRTDLTRQSAVIDAGAGEDAPFYRQYVGINSFALPAPETQLKPNDNILTGKVVLQSGSTGIDNFAEWATKQQQIENAQQDATDAKQAATNALANAKSYTDAVAKHLQDQLDGKVESYFFDYDPTLTNLPASEWTTDELKAEHLNDTFTNTESGRSWRWLEKDGVYQWVEIADTQSAEALAKAEQALGVANGKVAVFVTEPRTPYNTKDLWLQGKDGRIKRSITTRTTTGEFYAEDWVNADDSHEYTDSAIETYQQSVDATIANLNKAIENAEDNAKSYTDEGKEALQKSIEELDKAKANVTDVYDKATADGLINQAEADAIAAAQEYATAAQNLALELANAHADGKISEEEAKRIQEAIANLEAAKKYAEEKAQEAEDNAKEYADEQVATVDYLKEAFYQGAILDVNGVTLSHFIGVKNDQQEVVAGLYGGGSKKMNQQGYMDDDGNPLMIFAGAESVDNPESALFRVYGNGTTYTGVLKKSITEIYFDELDKYASYEENANGEARYILDISKCGSMVILNSSSSRPWESDNVYIQLPYLTCLGGNFLKSPASENNPLEFYSLVGSEIIIINQTGTTLYGCNGVSCTLLRYGDISVNKCVAELASGYLSVSWDTTTGFLIIS